MQQERYNTTAGSKTAPIYNASASELAIMALQTRVGRGPSRWLEARTDRGLQLDDAGAFRFWVDRAQGAKYVPAGALRPAVDASGSYQRVTFTGSLGQALVADDASDAFTDPEIYTIGLLTRQTPIAAGGAAIGNGASAADIAFPWFNPPGAALNYFSRGTVDHVLNNGVQQADGGWHTNLISIDTTQAATGARSQMRRDGAILTDNAGVPVALASSIGARRMTIGGAGRAGEINPFAGSIGAIIVIPGLALHLPANEAALGLVEGYLSALAGAL